ncbi:N-acetylmuramoyl-L-alanine amidase [Deinococcus radiopugnans]|uniref:N-acetylmuramoyl-L-alanine amidase n=1 Tax=Deinococcus radiopugnans ATCC 19172 TaxID=585398 RepID=A0ABR6NX05_9DEIO|nr:N-acetylmuramoyl-L-alanine amidase [Deinococcus radiopugnans ATCC 19172]
MKRLSSGWRGWGGAGKGSGLWRSWPLLAAALLLAGLAGAQITYGKLNLAGQQVESIGLYGAEYVNVDAVGKLVSVVRDGSVMRISGLGHTLLLPIDLDQERATTDFNTVQIDTRRLQGQAATWVNGAVYLPLSTLATGLGARYEQGKLTLVPPQLLGVSSRAGQDSDRLVLDLSRDVSLTDEARGSRVVVRLRGVKGEARKYTTRGAFLPSAEVSRDGDDLIVSAPITAASGYRVYKVVRPSGTRVVLDLGPGIPRGSPAILERVTRPLIVLDPVKTAGIGRDPTLDVARRAAEMLTKAGWQVQVTRDSATALNRDQKQQLARQSDVYLALDLGRFPGSTRGGVTVYEPTGRSPSQLVNGVRVGTALPYGSLVVGDTGGTRRLSELLRGELKGGNITAGQGSLSRVMTLSEAPQAALLLELGWASNSKDLANLSVERRLQALSVAVARSVATYLTARANNNANVGALAGAGQ